MGKAHGHPNAEVQEEEFNRSLHYKAGLGA